MAPLLQARDLQLRDPSAASATFSLTVGVGENLALVGPASATQTSLLRAVALLERPAAGAVIFAGRDYARAAAYQLRPLRQALQFVGPRPRQLLSPQWAVRDILTEPLRLHRLGIPATWPGQVATLAQQWGLNPHLLRRTTGALSMTLCLRVVLARALALQPRLLVCANFLEQVERQAGHQLLHQLTAYCRQAQLALLWATSDLALAQACADRVLCLEAGQLRPA